MLDQFRRNSRSFIIWILFGIIIAVFIISFGPASGQLTCGAPASFAGEVKGSEISADSWRFAVNGLGIGTGGDEPQDQQQRHQAMDLLIERELLADAAEQAGFEVPLELVNQSIADGNFYVLGFQRPAPYIDEDGVFSYEMLENFSRQLGMSTVDQFIEQQRRELAANFMRNAITEGVQVSDAEISAAYVRKNTTVQLAYVKLYPTAFEPALDLGDPKLAVYLAAHADEAKARYEERKRLYQDVDEQVWLRRIFVASGEDDAGRAKADRALRQIRGGADFSAVARKVSDDETSSARGGDLGWRSTGAIPNAAVAKAVDALEPGDVSEVIEVPDGFVITKVEGRREGDLSYDQVKLEIARELASHDVAQAYAAAAIAKANAGTPLSDLKPADVAAAAAAAGLPAPRGVTLPEVENVGPIPRPVNDFIAGIGESEALVTAAFETLAVGDVLAEPQQVGDALIVAKLEARNQADLSKLEERKDGVRQQLRMERAATTLAAWVQASCAEAAEAGDLAVNLVLLAGSETAPRVAYSACQTLSYQTTGSQIQSQMFADLLGRRNLMR